ncbi:Sae1 [Columba livia]|nr:Sae1 [Columba livia]
MTGRSACGGWRPRSGYERHPGAAGGDERTRSRSGQKPHLSGSQRFNHVGPSTGLSGGTQRAQFLVPAGSLGRNRAEASLERAQNLNPMVDVKARPRKPGEQTRGVFHPIRRRVFKPVAPQRRDGENQPDLPQKQRQNSSPGDVFGYHGYMFADLGEHEFVEEKTKITKVNPGVEDGPDTKKAKLDSSETTMVKKVSEKAPKTPA